MKSIAILGSTGSIGKSLIKIINKDKKFFDIKLLTARKNYKELLKQAKLFEVKNVVLTNCEIFNKKKKFLKRIKLIFLTIMKILIKSLIKKLIIQCLQLLESTD